MRILIVHPENQYFAGAEKVLGYFLEVLVKTDCQIAVAAAKDSRVAKSLPPEITPIWIEGNDSFSLGNIWRQAQILKRQHAEFPFDVIHGWAARDWELASLTGWLCRRPAVGTLHDHPQAAFISPKRQRLMRWCANRGLKKIVCVSSAVQNACVNAGYASRKLMTVHNGLPGYRSEFIEGATPSTARAADAPPFRIGFLGAFSERKGLRDFFRIADGLSSVGNKKWEWHLAGGAQNENGERLLTELRRQYKTKNWWKDVHWHGWVASPPDFLRTLDLLIVPSSEFDPFPTVLLETGQSGVPVLASRVGGVPEIIIEGQTGWLFEPGNVRQAVQTLDRIFNQPQEFWRQTRRQATRRIGSDFSAAKMVAGYRQIYSTLLL